MLASGTSEVKEKKGLDRVEKIPGKKPRVSADSMLPTVG
jgi:hypothetical protein